MCGNITVKCCSEKKCKLKLVLSVVMNTKCNDAYHGCSSLCTDGVFYSTVLLSAQKLFPWSQNEGT